MVRSCVVTLDKRVYASLAPGAMAYFHVDVPHGIGRGQAIYIRMEREGGDPVLMASSGQWPAVALEAVEDMVRAHYCAFESFQADVALHDLVIPDAARYRAPHALGEVHGFPAAGPGAAARWAIGVYNFDKVKSEACEISVLASLKSDDADHVQALPPHDSKVHPAERAAAARAAAGSRAAQPASASHDAHGDLARDLARLRQQSSTASRVTAMHASALGAALEGAGPGGEHLRDRRRSTGSDAGLVTPPPPSPPDAPCYHAGAAPARDRHHPT
jgi:hypothetical protein